MTEDKLVDAIDDSMGRLRSDSHSDLAGRMVLDNVPKSLQRTVCKVAPVGQMYLDYVTGHPGTTPAALRDVLQVSKGAISQNARRLIKLGLLTSYKQEDNLKAVHYAVTTNGQLIGAAHRKMRGIVHEQEQRLLDQYTDDEVAAINDFLKRAVGVLR